MNIAIVATTINGKIALTEQDNTSWGSKEDKILFAEATKKSGVIIFGKTTFDTIGKTLPHRKNVIMTFDKAEELNKEFSSIDNPPIFTSDEPNIIINKLKKEGFSTIFICGGKSIYTLFLKEHLIDQIWITIEPYIFNTKSIDFLGEINSDIYKLKLLEISRINQDSVNLKYQVTYE